MQADLFATDQDDLSLRSQILVLQTPDQCDSSLLVAFEWSNHLMVHRRVEIAHHPTLLLFFLELFDLCDILEAQHHAFFATEEEFGAFYDDG